MCFFSKIFAPSLIDGRDTSQSVDRLLEGLTFLSPSSKPSKPGFAFWVIFYF